MSVSETYFERPHGLTATRQAMGGTGKRIFDIAVASVMLLALAPVFALIALVIWITDPGPVFFGHTRLGLNGRKFKCLKFRSMVVDSAAALERHLAADPEARAEWTLTHKLKDDPRITAIGRLLRVTSLDELPQLINVLRGEMSLVGPRPIVTEEVSRYADRFKFYTMTRPGVTGLWQVSGRSDCSYTRRVDLDTQYVQSWRFRSDLTILVRTVSVVLKREGSC